MKTAYVASRFAAKERVKEIYSELEKMGYSIPGNWTNHQPIKPYEKYPELSEEYAVTDLDFARNSDLFILISEGAGTGMHTELGAAMDHFLEFKKPIIYVIGEHLDSSMFFFHPAIKRKQTIEQVIEELKLID